ncbi:hypothetical protein [Ralstonia sp. Ralssp110]|uniref:hypothetical protein n=1 Tax=Ralstonia sp. Ralssp110 TaxID=3243004 RepID=UPI0039B41F35
MLGITYLTAATQQWQGSLLHSQRQLICERRVEPVGDKIRFQHLRLVPVRPGDSGNTGGNIAATHILESRTLAGQIDILNTQLTEQCHLTALLHAVLVSIHPHRKLVEGCIVAINMTVAIAILGSKRAKAVLGQRAIWQGARIAEQLRSASDRTIRRVNQETTGIDPTNGFFLATIGEIKLYVAPVYTNC